MRIHIQRLRIYIFAVLHTPSKARTASQCLNVKNLRCVSPKHNTMLQCTLIQSNIFHIILHPWLTACFWFAEHMSDRYCWALTSKSKPASLNRSHIFLNYNLLEIIVLKNAERALLVPGRIINKGRAEWWASVQNDQLQHSYFNKILSGTCLGLWEDCKQLWLYWITHMPSCSSQTSRQCSLHHQLTS